MRLGVIGTGFVFDHYMTTMLRHPAIEIAGITDIDRTRAETVAAYYGLRCYPTADALLDDPTIDCVANFTSIPAHTEVIRDVLLPINTYIQRSR